MRKDTWINPRRRYNNCKYICTQHKSTSIYKANANSHKRGNRQWGTITVGDFNTSLTPMDRSSRQKINKETQALNDTLEEMDLMFIGHSIRKQQNTLSSQVHMEHSPGQITSWVSKQASVNVRKLKSYQASFPTSTLLD